MNKSNQAHTMLVAQRTRLLSWLRRKPISTFEARHELDIVAPAARVHDLRWKHGLRIKTEWVTEQNPGGGRHRIARYCLMPGKWKGGANNV